jgi:hypothetical protein
MKLENWGAEAWRQPTLLLGDVEIFAEHGRILDGGTGRGVDCRSHSFKLVKETFGPYRLCVKHGGGEERFQIDYCDRTVHVMRALTSDERYWLMHTILTIRTETARAASEQTARRYQKAFAEGRLKKRKKPNQPHVRVWIDDLPVGTVDRIARA